jgi:hypothetical protein
VVFAARILGRKFINAFLGSICHKFRRLEGNSNSATTLTDRVEPVAARGV